MTVEERAEKAVALMIDNRDQPLINVVAEILRDQIEECAKVADVIDNDLSSQQGATTNAKRGIARTIGRQIRALAAPTEENNSKQEKGE